MAVNNTNRYIYIYIWVSVCHEINKPQLIAHRNQAVALPV